jgi:hypothetical protein
MNGSYHDPGGCYGLARGLGRVGRFIIVFGLLTWPWAWLSAANRQIYQAVARELVLRVYPSQFHAVNRRVDPLRPSVDTEIVLLDRRRSGQDGTTAAKWLLLDSWSLGWVPNAMAVALLTAQPAYGTRPWWRWAGVLVTVNLVTVVAMLSAVHWVVSGGWVAMVLNRVLVENLWTTFTLPAVLVCLVFQEPARPLSQCSRSAAVRQ